MKFWYYLNVFFCLLNLACFILGLFTGNCGAAFLNLFWAILNGFLAIFLKSEFL